MHPGRHRWGCQLTIPRTWLPFQASKRRGVETGRSFYSRRTGLSSGTVARVIDHVETDGDAPADARARILESSYELFSHRGVRGVGVDEVIERAGVAKATLYRNFPSKDD